MLKIFAIIGLFVSMSTTAFAEEEDRTCDPRQISHVFEIAHLSDTSIIRARTGSLTWLRIQPTPDISAVPEAFLDEEGNVIASAIEINLEGSGCSVIADRLRIKGDNQWKDLRMFAENSFMPRYFQDRMAISQIDLGMQLVLFRRASCDITVNALVFKKTHPAMRLPPFPDPEC